MTKDYSTLKRRAPDPEWAAGVREAMSRRGWSVAQLTQELNKRYPRSEDRPNRHPSAIWKVVNARCCPGNRLQREIEDTLGLPRTPLPATWRERRDAARRQRRQELETPPPPLSPGDLAILAIARQANAEVQAYHDGIAAIYRYEQADLHDRRRMRRPEYPQPPPRPRFLSGPQPVYGSREWYHRTGGR